MGACAKALVTFKQTFGTRAAITPANLTIAEQTRGLDPMWLAGKLVGHSVTGLENCKGCKAERNPRRVLLAAARKARAEAAVKVKPGRRLVATRG
jgi:hypothetical protein